MGKKKKHEYTMWCLADKKTGRIMDIIVEDRFIGVIRVNGFRTREDALKVEKCFTFEGRVEPRKVEFEI